MKRTLYLLMLSCILASCQENEVQVVKEEWFKEEIPLKTSRVTTDELLSVQDFFVKDSLVVVRNNRDDSLFVIYTLPDFNCLKSFGEKGRGPDEFNMPQIIDKPSSKEFFIADFAMNKLTVCQADSPVVKKTMKFDYTGGLPQSVIYSSDSVFLFDTNQQEVNLHKMETNGSYTVLHDFKDLKQKYSHSNVYWGFLGTNDSLKRVVYAYQALRRFDIIDYNGNIIKKVKILPGSDPILTNDRLDTDKSMIHYFGVRTTDKSIFLYYVGHTGKELMNDLNITTYIEEYNWDGQPLKRYKLNHFIWNFDLLPAESSGKHSFIGLDQSNVNPFVILTPNTNAR